MVCVYIESKGLRTRKEFRYYLFQKLNYNDKEGPINKGNVLFQCRRLRCRARIKVSVSILVCHSGLIPERENERERVRVCVHVHVHVYACTHTCIQTYKITQNKIFQNKSKK